MNTERDNKMKVRVERNCFRRMLKRCIIIVCTCSVSHFAIGQTDFNDIRELISNNVQEAGAKVEDFHIQAVLSGDDLLLGQSNYLRGLIAYYEGTIKLAESYSLDALNYIDQDSSYRDLRSKIWNNLGVIYGMQENYGLALAALERSFELSTLLLDTIGSLKVSQNISLLEMKLGNYEAAKAYLLPTRDYLRGHNWNDDDLAATYYVNMGSIFVNEGGYPDSSKYYLEKAIEKFSGLNNLRGLISAKLNYALSMIAENNLEEANQTIQYVDSVNATHEGRDKNFEDLNFYRALLYMKKGEYKKALPFIEESIKTMEKREFQKGLEADYWMKLNALAGQKEYEAYLEAERNMVIGLTKIKMDNADFQYAEFREYYENRRIDYELIAKNQRVNPLDEKLERAAFGMPLKNKVILLITTFGAIGIALALLIRTKIRERVLRRQLESGRFRSFLQQKESDEATKISGRPDSSGFRGHGESAQLFQKLLALFEKEELFKEPHLNLAVIAQHLDSNVKDLSQAINTQSRTHFNGLINKYRVLESIRLIETQSEQVVRLRGIGYRVGFSSYRTFLRVFKEETGLAPREYLSCFRNH